MPSAQKFAGIAYVYVDGKQFPLRGNFTVSPSNIERTMIAGQDGVHGYQELPRVPYIEGDISALPDVSLDDLVSQVNVNVIAQLANGRQYSLVGSICKANLEENSRDGQMRVRWEGLSCEESSWNSPGTQTTSGQPTG
jgi:Phage tail tube protein